MVVLAPTQLVPRMKMNTPAKAFARRVFPQPGGPYSKTPLKLNITHRENTLGVERPYESRFLDALKA